MSNITLEEQLLVAEHRHQQILGGIARDLVEIRYMLKVSQVALAHTPPRLPVVTERIEVSIDLLTKRIAALHAAQS